MASTLIDVWDAKTFDEELIAILAKEAELVRNYMTTEHHIFRSHDLNRDPDYYEARPHNPYASGFLELKEAIGEQMQSRTIRAWHYTRMTESELEAMRRDGVHLSTPETLRARLDALVALGGLSAQLADTLFVASPFHSNQLKARSNKFWMVSHPLAVDDDDVKPLMARWGGEVGSRWTTDPALLATLTTTGKPRVLEFAVPLGFTPHSYSAAEAIVATFSRTVGCISSNHDFDLYVTVPLQPDAILIVHSEGEASFEAIGRSYPEGYTNLDGC